MTRNDFENAFVSGNYISLVSFVILLVTAIQLRKKPALHRRLLLFASITIIGPAFARFGFWPLFGGKDMLAPLFAVGGMVLLLIGAICYDWLVAKKLYWVTFAGVAGAILPIVVGLLLGISGIGYRILEAVRRA